MFWEKVGNLYESLDWWTNHHMFSGISILSLNKVCCCCLVTSVMFKALQSHGLQTSRLLCPSNSLGKSTGLGCHALLQSIFPTQGSNPGLLHCRQIFLHWATREGPNKAYCLLLHIMNGMSVLVDLKVDKNGYKELSGNKEQRCLCILHKNFFEC